MRPRCTLSELLQRTTNIVATGALYEALILHQDRVSSFGFSQGDVTY